MRRVFLGGLAGSYRPNHIQRGMDIAGKGDLPRVPREEFERDADGLKTPYTRRGTHENVEEEKEKKGLTWIAAV